MKNLLIISSFLVSTSLFAQAEVKEQANKQSVVIDQSRSRDLNDGYYGYKKEIISRMKESEIPATFPKYVQDQTEDEYKLEMLNWAKGNKHLIQEKFHVEILELEKKLAK